MTAFLQSEYQVAEHGSSPAIGRRSTGTLRRSGPRVNEAEQGSCRPPGPAIHQRPPRRSRTVNSRGQFPKSPLRSVTRSPEGVSTPVRRCACGTCLVRSIAKEALPSRAPPRGGSRHFWQHPTDGAQTGHRWKLDARLAVKLPGFGGQIDAFAITGPALVPLVEAGAIEELDSNLAKKPSQRALSFASPTLPINGRTMLRDGSDFQPHRIGVDEGTSAEPRRDAEGRSAWLQGQPPHKAAQPFSH